MTTGYPAIAAGVEVKPEGLSGVNDFTRIIKCKESLPSVGMTRASKLNCFKVPSMPRVRPRSPSAARASKNEALTVVASEVINLKFNCFCIHPLLDNLYILRLRGVEWWYELEIGVLGVESNEIGQVFHPSGHIHQTSDIGVYVYLNDPCLFEG